MPSTCWRVFFYLNFNYFNKTKYMLTTSVIFIMLYLIAIVVTCIKFIVSAIERNTDIVYNDAIQITTGQQNERFYFKTRFT